MPAGHLILALTLAVGGLVGDRALAAGTSSHNPRPEQKAARPSFPSAGIMSLTYKSPVDGSLQPLLAKVPRGYTPERQWPLLVTLHGAGAGPLLATEVDSMVQIAPSGRGSIQSSGIGARDVWDCIALARKLFSIDSDRMYLCGFSMGATAVFDLAFHTPDLWAACVPVCGAWDDMDMVANARHLPFWIHSGRHDTIVPPHAVKAVFDRAGELGLSEWRYTEHPDMEHDFSINWEEVEQWLLAQRRVTHPREVCFRTRTLQSSRAYWVEILAVRDYGRPAFIEARLDGQTITVRAENVANYALWLNSGLIDTTRPVRISEAGRQVLSDRLEEDGCFRRDAPAGGICKRPGLSGPLWDIYSRPCILIYGTGSDDVSPVEAARRCAESFTSPAWMNKVTFRIVADVDVSEADLRDHNVVLFGNAELNSVLARLDERLPVRMAGTSVRAGCREFSVPRGGYVLIYPNPLNPEHYVAVFAGNTADAIDCFAVIWPDFPSVPRDVDFGVFQLPSDSGAVKWLCKGLFDTRWDWPSRRPNTPASPDEQMP